MSIYLDKDYCLENTQILAEGSDYTFWRMYNNVDPAKIYCSKNWKQSNGGYIYTVGRINDRPINIELRWFGIDGVIVCLYDGISQLVDWKMIEDHLTEKFPKAKRIANATKNYHNVFHHICEINKKESKNKSSDNDEPSKKKIKK
jgi:hypothetical protein